MSKEEQFLWGVQTLLLLYANLHAHDPDVRKSDVSALGNYTTIRLAIAASTRIPKDMSVGDAIEEFHAAYSHKPKDDSPHTPPAWLSNLPA